MPIPPSNLRDTSTLRLMAHMVKDLVEEEKLPPDQYALLLPEYFLHWAEDKINVGVYSRDKTCEEASCDPIGWDFLQEILASAAGALMIAPMWPMVTLAHRGYPKHALRRFQMIMMLTWDDGFIYPLSVAMPKELCEVPFSDGFIASQINVHTKAFLREIVEKGLDRVHDESGANYGGDHPYEVMMGAFLQIIPQLGASYAEEEKKTLQKLMKDYVRLIQGLIAPPIPPNVKASWDAQQRKKAVTDPKQVRGGFDGG
jgi:hypothetical protein